MSPPDFQVQHTAARVAAASAALGAVLALVVNRFTRATSLRAASASSGALALLCVYVLATAAADLFGAAQSEGSVIGSLILLAAAIVMPWLAWTKRRLAQELGSEALRDDAAGSMTCGYMAATVRVVVLDVSRRATRGGLSSLRGSPARKERLTAFGGAFSSQLLAISS